MFLLLCLHAHVINQSLVYFHISVYIKDMQYVVNNVWKGGELKRSAIVYSAIFEH